MKKIVGLLLLICTLDGPLYASSTFNRHFLNNVSILSVLPLSDGSCLVAGVAVQGVLQPVQPLLFKLNKEGRIVWSFEYRLEQQYSGFFRKIIQAETPQTFYVIGERSNVDNDDSDPLLLKINTKGVVIWKKVIAAGFSDSFYDLVKTPEGVIIAGQTGSFGRHHFAGWVVHFTRTGSLLWSRVFDRDFDDYFRAITVTEDSGYLLAGSTDIFGFIPGEGFKGIVVKVSKDGSYQWHRIYSAAGAGHILLFSATSSPAGGYVLSGSHTKANGDEDALVLKVDSLGKLIWKRAIGGRGPDSALSVVGLTNGDIAVAGEFESTISKTDGFLALFSALGKVRQFRLFGDNFDDTLQFIVPSIDGSFFIGGDLYSPFNPAASDFQGIVMKLNSALLLESPCAFLRIARTPIKQPFVRVFQGSLIDFSTEPVSTSFNLIRKVHRPALRQFCTTTSSVSLTNSED